MASIPPLPDQTRSRSWQRRIRIRAVPVLAVAPPSSRSSRFTSSLRVRPASSKSRRSSWAS
jgi:hypothetical protein